MKLPEKYFLYVGNAYPHKNLEKLLEAFLSIRYKQSFSANKVSGIKLILVGGEDYFYRRLKEKVKERELEKEVLFYGSASREELTNLYQKALALIFPSLMEGFGLPGLEAMANGCPVVCSDIPVFREIYDKAAVYFDPTDVNDISAKLEAICSSVLKQWNREEMVKRGLEQVKKYSWEKLAKETLEVYRQFIK